LGTNDEERSEWLSLLKSFAKDPSPIVRLEVAAALQRLPLSDRWDVAEVLLSNADDAKDHNIPLMIWYAVEPLVADHPARAMQFAKTSAIPLVKRFLIRRAASDNELLPHAVALLNESKDAESQLLVLEEILAAFEGRVDIPMPDSWTAAYDSLAKSENETIRQRTDQVAVALGDKRIFPRMREVLSDKSAEQKARKQALDILVRGRDADAVPAFQAVLDQAELRGAAIRALAAFDDAKTPAAILKHYGSFDADAKGDAIGTLTSRPQYAFALLTAMKEGQVPRTDLHAYHVRQLLRFENEKLDETIRDVWGEFRETSADKQQQIATLKSQLTPKVLRAGDASHGRHLFSKTCANCHTLFGEGGKVGPDITGSDRANLDYILSNIVDPSAVLGKDYRMSVLALADGRVVSGLVQKETDSALTVRTLNDTVVIPLADVEERKLSELSMMPEKLLDQLSSDAIRDLVAYLQSPQQVALKGPRSPIDPKTGRVEGALEGESLKIIGKSRGSASSQPMSGFTKDHWSGNDQLWWTGAKPGDHLDLEIPVEANGTYTVEIVFTRARDYGITQLALDDLKLGGPVDFFNEPDVVTTGVLSFENIELSEGNRRLKIEILGANPKAVKGYMVGLDYIRLVPTQKKSD
jgi:putative heme-binding domain-containing protein